MVDSPPSDPARLVPSVRSSLMKRQHEECWSNYLSHSQQEAYEDDCQRLLSSMERSHITITFAPEQSKDFFTSHRICKLTVRNQQKASCNVNTQSVNRATMGKSLERDAWRMPVARGKLWLGFHHGKAESGLCCRASSACAAFVFA
ncbi:hypothetical protein N7533_012589 [Penicillium manginii]|uniref:uncharacterized protein n=1 Tax=Penicillium manginii TaxID=203109 RepID=UPI002548FF32|nr:uncharacterized protein N7533_012589 [Penicillium manginii]KAJ5739805.1 hypothetical protein N7533_012589 [Penicillium manginii]